MPGPNGTIGHAEVKIGDSSFLLTDEYANLNFFGPATVKRSTVHVHVCVEDVDAFFEKAPGARVVQPSEDRFYGDRTGSLEDPFKHV